MNTDEPVQQLAEVIRRKHLALATEQAYCAWLRRYCNFLNGLPLHLPSEHKLERFLTVLTQKDVAASTQNQPCNAIISKVPRRPQGGVFHSQSFNFIRAKFNFELFESYS